MTLPQPTLPEVYRFGPFRLDCAARRLTRAGEVVSLPPKAYELLQILVRNAHRAVPRTELLDQVWRDTVVEEGSLGWNMSVLRKALDDADGTLIETVRGYGYRMALQVARGGAGEADDAGPGEPDSDRLPAPPRVEPRPAESAPEPPAGGGARRDEEVSGVETAMAAATPSDPASRNAATTKRRGRVAMLLLVALSVVAIWRLARSPEPEGAVRPTATGANGLDDRPVVAVLPFENLSKRPDDDWLSVALAELLTSELALGGETSTIAGESVAAAARDLGIRAGAALAPRSVAALETRLGFDEILVGTYLVIGEPPTLRVDLRLQRASGGAPTLVWRTSRPLEQLPELATEAGERLRTRFGGDAVPADAASAARTESVVAVRLYAEGVELRRRFQLAAARERFEQALEASPELVVARAALAGLLAELGDGRRALDESRRALAAAGRLAPIERLPIEARARELAGDWSGAAVLWKQVVALDARALESQLSLARALSRAGRHDEARSVLDGLSWRPPPDGTNPRILLERGWVERYAQNDLEAMKRVGGEAERIGRAMPSDLVVAEALAVEAWAEWALAEHEQAIAACTEGARVARELDHRRLLAWHLHRCGWVDWQRGRYDEARAWFEETVKVAEPEGDLDSLAGGLLGIGWVELDLGRLAAAAAPAARALATARASGDGLREANTLELVSRIAYDRGELEEAEARALEGLSVARAINVPGQIAIHSNALGRIRRERGDLVGAVAAGEEAVRVQPPMFRFGVAEVELELARSLLAAGRTERAVEVGRRALTRLETLPPTSLSRYVTQAFVARGEAVLGHRDVAVATLERLERSGADLTIPPLALAAQLERAELLLVLGERARARAAFAAIVAAPGFGEERLVLDALRRRLASGELD